MVNLIIINIEALLISLFLSLYMNGGKVMFKVAFFVFFYYCLLCNKVNMMHAFNFNKYETKEEDY